MQTRTERFKETMRAEDRPMTVREICEKAGIPAEEAKFVSSGLIGEVKKGRVEVGDQVVCPVTQRKSITYKLLPAEPKDPKPPKAKAKAVAQAPTTTVPPIDPSQILPDPMVKRRKAKKA